MRYGKGSFRWLALALMSCALSSCAHSLAVTSLCIPMKDYSPQEQQKLADAVEALPASSPLVQAMADYGQMRAANRACKK